jgi:PAS domain S-box-containing protein
MNADAPTAAHGELDARLAPAWQALPLPVLLVRTDAMVVDANAAAAALLDLPSDGRRRLVPLTRFVTEAQVFLALRRAIASGEPTPAHGVGPARLRVGAQRVLVADLHVGHAAPHAVVVIAERRGWGEAEARLQQQQAEAGLQARRAQQVMIAAQLAGAQIVACDAQQRVEWVNPAFEQATGWPLDELRGQRLSVLHGPATDPDAVNTMRRALSRGEGFVGQEVLNYRRDGTPYWVDVSVAPMHDGAGRVEGFVGVSLNIDARKRAEAELAEREGLLRGVFAAAPDAALVVRRDGIVAEANQSAHRLLGWPGGPGASPIAARDAFASADRGAFDVALQRALFGSAQTLELATAGGTVCVVKLWPLWRRAETHAVLVVLVDQTEARAAEARRRVVEATAAANQLRSEFLSRVSHELRTPLNAILGFAQLLDTGSRVSRGEMVQHIMKAGRHLLALIDDVLDLSSAASGELRVSLGDVMLAPLVQEIVALQAPVAAQAGVTIDAGGVAPELAVRADPLRLQQVLTNLVSNAVKYNLPGGRVSVTAQPCPGGRVEIAVTDTGVGMTDAQQQALFQPFNRLGAERRRIGGTGIGLVVTQSLVKAMGGHLQVESAPGEGSRFAFGLAGACRNGGGAAWHAVPRPASLPSMAVADGAPAWTDALPPTIAAPLAPSGPTRHVLCLEDDPTNAMLVSAALHALPDVTLRVADSIDAGLRAYAEQPAQVVLLDMHLPDGHGLEALDRLRRLPVWGTTKVIALSADAEKSHIRDALAAGVDVYLTKPIVIGALLDSVRHALDAVAEAPAP